MRFRHIAMMTFAATVATGCSVISRVSMGGGDDDQPQIIGTGPLKSETRTLPTFKRVSLNSGIEATIVVGGKQSVSVKAMSNLVKAVKTKVVDGVLTVDIEDTMSSKQPIQVFITVPSLTSLSANGGVSANVIGVKAPSFAYSGDGGSSVQFNGDIDKLDVNLNGGAQLDLKGSARSASIKTDGGCTMNARKFAMGAVKVASGGGSSVQLGKTSSLDAKADGGATINYQGSTKVIRAEADASGTISQK